MGREQKPEEYPDLVHTTRWTRQDPWRFLSQDSPNIKVHYQHPKATTITNLQSSRIKITRILLHLQVHKLSKNKLTLHIPQRNHPPQKLHRPKPKYLKNKRSSQPNNYKLMIFFIIFHDSYNLSIHFNWMIVVYFI